MMLGIPCRSFFLDWLSDCYCVRDPLRLVLKINLIEKRLNPRPSIGEKGLY